MKSFKMVANDYKSIKFSNIDQLELSEIILQQKLSILNELRLKLSDCKLLFSPNL